MKIQPIEDNNSTFDKVVLEYIRINHVEYKYVPYCKQHGAMNKVSRFYKGGYWRCLQGLCRAGCQEIN